MPMISGIEFVSAAFVFAILIRLLFSRNRTTSNKYLKICLISIICTLLVDASAYIFVGVKYPLAIRYIINLLAFEAGAINAFLFTLYLWSFAKEKININKWFFIAALIVISIWFIAILVEFIAGRFIRYDASGMEIIDYSIPLYLTILSLSFIVYLSIITIVNVKKIGLDFTILFCAFNAAPIVGVLVSKILTYDYSYIFGALTLILVTEFIEEKQFRKMMQQANEESTLRSMIYQISDSSEWSYEIDNNDNVISAKYSDKLLKVVRTTPSGKAMGWVKLVHPDDKERVLNGFMSAIKDHSGKTYYDETYRIMNKDKTYRYVRSVGCAMRRSDGSGKLVGLAMDFTEQFKEQEKHKNELAEALALADSASKAKTQFLFNMSHDIRTPMNAIIGFTNIAKKDINNPTKALESLNKVQLSSNILLNLINDVLDMSRIESGKVELHETKHNFIEAFDSFEPAMANLAAAKDIDLEFSISNIRDEYVYADGPRFDRVLINIISNAIKYTPSGGFVKVSAEQIEDTKPGYGNYRFIISDSGIGMSKEFQEHMFENFTREENATTRTVQGTGLGLALSKSLVDLMGGTILCKSKKGVGTTFTIIFPFKLQTDEDTKKQLKKDYEIKEVVLKGKRALLVEDNQLNREIAEEILLEEGVIVETASDGQIAVNKVREKDSNYYDFILMDVQMPVMNGYEATKAIHDLIPGFKTPIIALSANAFAEDKETSIKVGMVDHVAKPIDPNELKNVLKKCLKERKIS